MLLPNLLIIGAQKSGTTWLHSALAKSPHIFSPKIKGLKIFGNRDLKELNFFNTRNPEDNIAEYAANFAESKALFRIESTPHYFRLPTRRNQTDVSANIARIVPDAHLILALRNPVERYLSAYTHHLIAGRLPYREELVEVQTTFGLIDLGNYADILEHWQMRHKNIQIFLYEDIVGDPLGVVQSVGKSLGVDLGLTKRAITFRINDKKDKVKKKPFRQKDPLEGRPLPVLVQSLEEELREIYRPQTERLSKMIDRNLDHWMAK